MRANTTMDITMSKFLAMGMGWQEVVYRSTQRPAEVIRRPKLGHIGVGADADIAILNVREGDFGFVDSGLARIKGNQKVECRLTMCAGKIVWDDEGISTLAWEEAGDYKHVP
jgi:dihydroorotase